MASKGLIPDLNEEDVQEIHRTMYSIARNLWSLSLLVCKILTGSPFDVRQLKMDEGRDR